MLRRLFLVGIFASLVGCSDDDGSLSELDPNLLAGGETFIAVQRDVGGTSASFYLAVKLADLEQRWFLSAYMKQYYPGDVNAFAAASLGTRVVSFRLQNDKLFVIDVADGTKSSEVFDPDILVEAYPIIKTPSFEGLRDSDKYVLIDPAAGLNKFSVTGEIYGDPYLAQFGTLPFSVGLAYLQSFRAIDDGVTFEQVFTGEIDFGDFQQSAWGTLGVAFRRYQEGEGYVPTETPPQPHYFLSDYRLVPDSGGFAEVNPVRWNLHPGMEPIPFLITAGANRAQADFPDVDLLGAFERGIETWNDVLGFQAFDAQIVDEDDVFARDDVNALIVDYPGSGAPFAFADWRQNPNTGEIRGGSIFFSGVFLSIIPFLEDDAPTVAAAKERPQVLTFLWGGMPARRPPCVLWAPEYRQRPVERLRGDTSLTASEKAAHYVQHVIAHEMGHVLGLRHNFKGSLVPPSTTVMEYLDDFSDAIAMPTPGSYDVDAIHYLYQQSTGLPTQPFCTDGDVDVDPECVIFDSTADPLVEWHAPYYLAVADDVIAGDRPVEALDGGELGQILGYARASHDPAQAVAAMEIALGRTAVPVSAEDGADPTFAEPASEIAAFVLRRLFFEPSGYIVIEPTEPAVLAYVTEQAGGMIRNVDGVRSFPLRRLAVDVLKTMQTVDAYLALQGARDALAAQLSGGSLAPADVPLVQDLLARVDRAITPYFD